MSRPGRAALVAVWVVTTVVPTPAARARYRAELAAELHDLPAGERVRQLAGLFRHAWALRAAVASGPAARRPVTPGCWTGLHHLWQTEHTVDGGRYQRCRRCGKDDPTAGRTVTGAMVPGCTASW